MRTPRLLGEQMLRVVITAIACLSLAGGAGSRGDNARKTPDRPIVDMVIENRGTIRLEMLPGAAPKTVAHFLGLVDKRFYDGILFHRVEAKQLVQAGDPESRKVDGKKLASITPTEVSQLFHLGLGGSGKTVPLEANAACVRGTLGLARSASPDSGDSQFFLNLADNHRLDNQYTVFGKVVEGLAVMDHIQQGDRIKSIRRVTKPGGALRRGPLAR